MVNCMACPVRDVCAIFEKHQLKYKASNLPGISAYPASIDYDAEGKEIPGNYALCPLYQLVKD